MLPYTTKTLLLTTLLSLQKATAAAANNHHDENAPETAAGPGCTTTITLTQSRLPTPPYWPQCSWDGTLSIYSATVTATRSVDCSGCTEVRVTHVPEVHCPARIVSTSVFVERATTVYETVCLVTPTLEP
ncbi:hypothetical protein CCMA1212_003064 [Trichoderma ghanense]|uniref:SSCRP protein n=1 Tax=Trichoderma ghanense TaxID=65468 RepID=A0ABY2HBH6_9HYPO